MPRKKKLPAKPVWWEDYLPPPPAEHEISNWEVNGIPFLELQDAIPAEIFDKANRTLLELERIRVALIRRHATPEAAGWVRLNELLEAARNDPAIAASRPASDFLALMLEVVGDSLFAKSEDEALQPLLAVLASEDAKERSALSHQGRAATKAEAERLFLAHSGGWKAINEAAAAFSPAVLAFSKNHPRPLTRGNAQRTIASWLSELVQNDPEARAKLTPKAQKRLETAPKRPR